MPVPLFLLKRIPKPFQSDWININGLVIRADNEEEARNLAHDNYGDANEIWLDRGNTTSEEIAAEGASKVIFTDFRAAEHL